jgi:hypothetical protein
MGEFDRHHSAPSAQLSASLLFAVIASAFQVVSLLAGIRWTALPWIVMGIFVPIGGILSRIAGARKGLRFGVAGSFICAGNMIVTIWFLARHMPFAT